MPQKNLNNRVLTYDRGRGLGGSTEINFAAYDVGPKDDYDRWARLMDDDSFNWETSVRKRKTYEHYDLETSEKYSKYYKPDAGLHGTSGTLHVGVPQVWETSMTEIMDAAEEAGLGLQPDLNDGVNFGLAVVPSTTTKQHRRSTARTAFLADVPDNLKIITEQQVKKILFDGTRPIGIETVSGKCDQLQCTSIAGFTY